MEVIEPRLHNISRFNLVFDHLEPESWILDLLFRMQGCKIQDTRFGLQDSQYTGSKMQDAGCKIQVAGFRIQRRKIVEEKWQ